MKNEKIYLSIIIPAYNEEANLAATLQDVADYLKSKDYTYEVIIVDDGSKDKTAEIAFSLGNLFKAFSLLKNITNHGKGYSVKRGVLFAKGEFILFMDADNSTRICESEKLLDAITKGYDVAIASRRLSGSMVEASQPIYRIVLGNIYILLSKLILGTAVRDYNCGFKLYTKKAAALLFPRLTKDGWSFDSELIYLIYKYKLKIKEVPICWTDKSKTSKVKPIRDGIKSLLSLIDIRLQSAKKIYD